ncbi:hypothetical protein K432DRAFT_384399, partial [Lepidopterella palustris CBS 459.81]
MRQLLVNTAAGWLVSTAALVLRLGVGVTLSLKSYCNLWILQHVRRNLTSGHTWVALQCWGGLSRLL